MTGALRLQPRTISWLHADAVMLFTGPRRCRGARSRVPRSLPSSRPRRVAVSAVDPPAQGVVPYYTQYPTKLPIALVLIHAPGHALVFQGLTYGAHSPEPGNQSGPTQQFPRYCCRALIRQFPSRSSSPDRKQACAMAKSPATTPECPNPYARAQRTSWATGVPSRRQIEQRVGATAREEHGHVGDRSGESHIGFINNGPSRRRRGPREAGGGPRRRRVRQRQLRRRREPAMGATGMSVKGDQDHHPRVGDDLPADDHIALDDRGASAPRPWRSRQEPHRQWPVVRRGPGKDDQKRVTAGQPTENSDSRPTDQHWHTIAAPPQTMFCAVRV